LPALTVEAVVIVSLIIGVIVVAGLLIFLKKRKH
jgi:LPXTG-motif cell wall-anchored protein